MRLSDLSDLPEELPDEDEFSEECEICSKCGDNVGERFLQWR